MAEKDSSFLEKDNNKLGQTHHKEHSEWMISMNKTLIREFRRDILSYERTNNIINTITYIFPAIIVKHNEKKT